MDNFENRILRLLAERNEGKTICPSEVLPEDEKQDPNEMEKVREAARRLAAKGEIVFTQKGKVIDPNNIKGPIRLRLKTKEN